MVGWFVAPAAALAAAPAAPAAALAARLFSVKPRVRPRDRFRTKEFTTTLRCTMLSHARRQEGQRIVRLRAI